MVRLWGLWLSWIEQGFPKAKVVGSSPASPVPHLLAYKSLGLQSHIANRRDSARIKVLAVDTVTQIHDLRLRLLVQQESDRIIHEQAEELDLSVVQARSLCWLALLAEAHEEQACDAERRGNTEQAMGWFADAMRLRDAIQLVSSIEIPLPERSDQEHFRGGT